MLYIDTLIAASKRRAAEEAAAAAATRPANVMTGGKQLDYLEFLEADADKSDRSVGVSAAEKAAVLNGTAGRRTKQHSPG